MFVRTVLMPLFEWQQRYRVYTLMSYGGFQRLKSNIPKFADDTYILKGLLPFNINLLQKCYCVWYERPKII